MAKPKKRLLILLIVPVGMTMLVIGFVAVTSHFGAIESWSDCLSHHDPYTTLVTKTAI